MKTSSASLFLFLLFSYSVIGQTINAPKLDSLIDAIALNNKGMGTFSIVKDNTVYERSIGYSRFDTKELANRETLYRIGSITKMLTAIITFQLIEEGKLSLETPVSKFFPNQQRFDNMTIATLLNHRSGLYDFVNESDDNDWLTKPQQDSQIFDTIIKGKLYFEPDTAFSYSNSGYFILVKILEKIERKMYHKIFNKRIVSKIKLKNTFCRNTSKTHKREALPYRWNTPWAEIDDFHFTNITGIGDVLSTPSDLVEISKALFNGRLLSNESLSQMQTFEGGPYGLGIMKTPFKSQVGYGHAGDTYGTHSIIVLFPDSNFTVAFCLNGQVMPRNELAIAILKICFNEKYTIPTFKYITVDPGVMQTYVGEYTSEKLPFKFKVFIAQGDLYVQATDQDAILVKPQTETEFVFEEINASFNFDMAKKQMIFRQGNASFVCIKS